MILRDTRGCGFDLRKHIKVVIRKDKDEYVRMYKDVGCHMGVR